MLSETGQEGTSVLYKETNRVGKGLSHTSLSDVFFMPHNKNPEYAVKDCTKYKYKPSSSFATIGTAAFEKIDCAAVI